MPAIIPGFNFYCISVSCIVALEASERQYGLCLAVCRTSQTGTWDGWWVWPRHGTSKTKLQMHRSSTHMVYNIFRCGIWILRQFTKGEAHLCWNVTVFIYRHSISSAQESCLRWSLKHQALENIPVLPIPQHKDPLYQTGNLCTLSLTPGLNTVLWNSVPTLSHRPFTVYLMELSQHQWPGLRC